VKTIATICARGGSQGLPGKNIRPLCGKPLIAHSIALALAHPRIDSVYVSTDDAAIAEVARGHGALVPSLRPAELATSNAAKLPAIEHLVGQIEALGVEISRIVDLDPTSPLRAPVDVDACLDLLDCATDCVITAYPADKNPYFNMVELDEGGYAGLSKTLDGRVVRRQDAPAVFAMNASIYVWHRHTLTKGIWSGRTRLHVMPRERSIDVDSLLDFELVELIMRKRANG
jgi:CMP-N-acetylneuraminic acid synthetase